MSSSSSNANPNLVPAAEPVVWRTTFEVNGRPVTIEDIVMDDEDTVVAVARDMILPRDEIMLAARTDIEVVNQSLALSIRATSCQLQRELPTEKFRRYFTESSRTVHLPIALLIVLFYKITDGLKIHPRVLAVF